MSVNVVLLGTYPSLHADRLKRLLGPGYEMTVLPDNTPLAERDAVLSEAEILVANRLEPGMPLSRGLRLIQSPSAGLDGIDRSALPPGVELRAASGHGPAMAEYVVCAMLQDALSFPAMTDTFAAGTWHSGDFPHGPRHKELSGRVVGLLGYGTVAREIAGRVAAFGTRIRAYSRSGPQVSDIAGLQAFTGLPELPAFLDGLDYLVITLPLTDETEGFVNTGLLEQLPQDAYLINVSRGGVVEEEDLYNAVRHGMIRGACIDVWYQYPDASTDMPVQPSSFPFHKLDGVTMTPHCSGRTEGTFERRWAEIASNIAEVATTLMRADT